MTELTQDELKERAISFFGLYDKELGQIKDLLEIKLKQIALAYTIENNLPAESIIIKTRIKSLGSFLRKLSLNKWPQFYYPTEVVTDLVGARIICWFVDDCYGIKKFIDQSGQIEVLESSIEDYIEQPKKSGYRSIHLLTHMLYDLVKRNGDKVKLEPTNIKAEIQIRTRLQDAWAEVTHDFHYKTRYFGMVNKERTEFLLALSTRIAKEDDALIELRNVYVKNEELHK